MKGLMAPTLEGNRLRGTGESEKERKHGTLRFLLYVRQAPR